MGRAEPGAGTGRVRRCCSRLWFARSDLRWRSRWRGRAGGRLAGGARAALAEVEGSCRHRLPEMRFDAGAVAAGDRCAGWVTATSGNGSVAGPGGATGDAGRHAGALVDVGRVERWPGRRCCRTRRRSTAG